MPSYGMQRQEERGLCKTESQNHRSWKGPLDIIQPNLPESRFLAIRASCWLVVNLWSTISQLLATRTLRSFSTGLLSSSLTCTVTVVVPPQAQGPIFAHVEPHQVPLHSTLQHVQVLLNGIRAFWCVSYSSQFCIISNLVISPVI